jgi:hypothetical protein
MNINISCPLIWEQTLLSFILKPDRVGVNVLIYEVLTPRWIRKCESSGLKRYMDLQVAVEHTASIFRAEVRMLGSGLFIVHATLQPRIPTSTLDRGLLLGKNILYWFEKITGITSDRDWRPRNTEISRECYWLSIHEGEKRWSSSLRFWRAIINLSQKHKNSYEMSHRASD